MRARDLVRRLVLVTALSAGLCLTAWPVVGTLVTDHTSRREAAAYSRQEQQQTPASASRALTQARRYNTELPPTLLTDPWGATQGSVAGPAHDRYLQQLSDRSAMGRLRIPAIDVDLPILHDADDASLRRGIGHMYGTALPVGGPGTHAVLAGHTGWRGATFFDRLHEIGRGATFTVETAGTTLTYRVDRVRIVDAWELDAVRPEPGRDLVTLVTCITPYGEHKQRLLVRGQRVADARTTTQTGAEENHGPSLPPVQAWMWPRLLLAGATAVVLVGACAWWVVTDRRARRRRRSS